MGQPQQPDHRVPDGELYPGPGRERQSEPLGRVLLGTQQRAPAGRGSGRTPRRGRRPPGPARRPARRPRPSPAPNPARPTATGRPPRRRPVPPGPGSRTACGSGSRGRSRTSGPSPSRRGSPASPSRRQRADGAAVPAARAGRSSGTSPLSRSGDEKHRDVVAQRHPQQLESHVGVHHGDELVARAVARRRRRRPRRCRGGSRTAPARRRSASAPASAGRRHPPRGRTPAASRCGTSRARRSPSSSIASTVSPKTVSTRPSNAP